MDEEKQEEAVSTAAAVDDQNKDNGQQQEQQKQRKQQDTVESLRRELEALRGKYEALSEQYEEKLEWQKREFFFREVEAAGALATQRQFETGLWKAGEIPAVTKCGWLVKKKHHMSNLIQQRRWFVLVGNQLFYFKSHDDTEPRGTLLLDGCSVRIYSQEELCFQLVAPASNKIYFLFAQNETLLDEWVSAVADASVMGNPHEQQLRIQKREAPAVNERERKAKARSRTYQFLEKTVVTLLNGDPVQEHEFTHARKLVKTDVGVQVFAQVLNFHRHKSVLTNEVNFKNLVNLMRVALLTSYEVSSYVKH
eukprot:TRINITY_DN66917_c9_g10_i3.p2 TRINITY_DN66917_c9_g10~~TRINITY_DN66917_c9_g10_i3.p2  ORF type:complete len:324 (-),score=150.98 TRINITY_DN66917_c9_g10_i3:325-1251(-)